MGIWSGKWKRGDGPESNGSYHSRAYHNHFEGYTEVKMPKKNGKGSRIARYYTGQYFSQELTDGQWKRNKMLFLFLLITGAVVFGFFACVDRNNNKVWFTQMTQAVVLCCFLWLLYVMISYLSAPRNMTVGQYRSSSIALVNSGKVTAGAIWLSALAQLCYACMPDMDDRAAGFVCGAAFGISGAVIYGLAVLESRIVYTRYEKEDRSRMEGIEIQR